MKTAQILESEIRKHTFKSHVELRSWLQQHPLLVEYATDLLLERGAMKVLGSGVIMSGAIVASAGGVKKDQWKANWPDMRALMNAVFDPTRFKDAQAELKERGHVFSFWLCIHALKGLINRGWVQHDGDLYALTDAGKAERKRLMEEMNGRFDAKFIEVATRLIRNGKLDIPELGQAMRAAWAEDSSVETDEDVWGWVGTFMGDGRIPKAELTNLPEVTR